MASILRFAWRGRRFSEYFSMGRLKQYRSLATQNDKVDHTLNKLEVNAWRERRISLKSLKQLFEDLKGTGSPDDSRSKLGNIIWTTLEENGCVFDVSHYNLLLKIHLKNEYNFNPMDFLAQMEAKNVTPNRVTCQRLISRYCQLGDMEGAGKILEFMKKKEFTINKYGYSALIIGHVRSNDIEAAKGVFDSMMNSKIAPTGDACVSLLYACAVRGDIENIKQILDEVGEKSYFLVKKHYLEIICNLAKNGHLQHVVEIRELYSLFKHHNLGATPVILKLFNCDREEVAMQLLGHLPSIVGEVYYPELTRHFLIRQLVELERPIEKIVEICKDMKTSGMNTLAFHKATETALKIGKTDLALKLIKTMKEENLPVRTRYFWPILMDSNRHNETELYEIFDLMMVCGCPANYTMFVYFYSLINTDDYKLVITKLRDFGYKLDEIVSPLVEFYVSEKKLEKACSLLNEYPIKTNVTYSLIRRMAVTCKQTNDMKTTVQLLKLIKEETDWDNIDGRDIVGQFLLTYSRIERNVEKVEILVKEMLQNRLQISPEMGDLVRRILQLDEQDLLTSTLQTLTVQFSKIRLEEMEKQAAESNEGLIVKLPSEYLIEQSELEAEEKAKDDRWKYLERVIDTRRLNKRVQNILSSSEKKKIERQTQGRKFWFNKFSCIDDEMLALYGYPREELNNISMAINITKVFSYLCGIIQNQRRTAQKKKSASAELEDEDAEWKALKVEFEAELEALNDRWAIELVDDLKAVIAELKTEDVELEAEDAEFKAEFAELKAGENNLINEKEYYTDWGEGDDEYSDWESEDSELEDDPLNELENDPVKVEFEPNFTKNYDDTTELLADILCVSKRIKKKTELGEFWINFLKSHDKFRTRLFDFLGKNDYPDEELNTISVATNITKVFSYLIRIMRNQ